MVEISENFVEFAFDSQIFAVAFSFDQFSESGFLGQGSSFSVDDFCGKSGVFRSDGALFRSKSVPAAWLGRFHPVSNFEEVSEIVSNQAALLFSPWQVGDTSDFVDSDLDWSGMKQGEVVLWVSQWNSPWVVSTFLTAGDFEDQVEIGWALATLGESWDFFGLEVIFGELSQGVDRVEDVSTFVVNTDIVVNGMISVLFWFSWEESELGFKGTEGFFAAQFSLLIWEDEVSEEQDVSYGKGWGEVVDVLSEQENS